MSNSQAQGRLPGRPVAIVDIGSNSVRLVAYESHSRAPTPTFNEKALCGLGKGVATTGLLPEDAVAKARGGDLRAAEAGAIEALWKAGFGHVDYVAIRDAETLDHITTLDRPARILAAAKIGNTRLIDNMAI